MSCTNYDFVRGSTNLHDNNCDVRIQVLCAAGVSLIASTAASKLIRNTQTTKSQESGVKVNAACNQNL